MLHQVGLSLAAIPGKLNIAHGIILAISGQLPRAPPRNGAVQVRLLAGDSPDAYNDVDRPGRAVPETREWKRQGRGSAVAAAPRFDQAGVGRTR